MKHTAPSSRQPQEEVDADTEDELLPGFPTSALFSLFLESLCDDTTPGLHDVAANAISSLAAAAHGAYFDIPAKLRACFVSIKAVVSRSAALELKAASTRTTPLPADPFGERMCGATNCLLNLAGASDGSAALVAALLATTPGADAVIALFDAVYRGCPPHATHAFFRYLPRSRGGAAQPLDDATLKEWGRKAHSAAQRAERLGGFGGGGIDDPLVRAADDASRHLLTAAARIRPFAPRAAPSPSPSPSPYERLSLVRAAAMRCWAALRAGANAHRRLLVKSLAQTGYPMTNEYPPRRAQEDGLGASAWTHGLSLLYGAPEVGGFAPSWPRQYGIHPQVLMDLVRCCFVHLSKAALTRHPPPNRVAQARLLCDTGAQLVTHASSDAFRDDPVMRRLLEPCGAIVFCESDDAECSAANRAADESTGASDAAVIRVSHGVRVFGSLMGRLHHPAGMPCFPPGSPAAAAAARVVWRLERVSDREALASAAAEDERTPRAKLLDGLRVFEPLSTIIADTDSGLHLVASAGARPPRGLLCDAGRCVAALGAASAAALLAGLGRITPAAASSGGGGGECAGCRVCVARREAGLGCGLPECNAYASDGVRLRLCSGCGVAAYSCDAHAADDWRRHKPACRAAKSTAGPFRL